MKKQYRIPVCYLCCKEYFSDDNIEDWPDFDGIEVYDDETEERL